MATQPRGEQTGHFVSVEDYISTNYEPDCEFDDGIVVKRNVGEFEHSFLQSILATVFNVNMDPWGVFALTEQRVQIKSTKFLIPDVCVLQVGAHADPIIVEPPLIAIEIMSPEDPSRRLANKAVEYLDFGIKHVWVIDPNARVAFRGTHSGLERIADGEFLVPETPIVIRTAELFDKLDRIRALGSR